MQVMHQTEQQRPAAPPPGRSTRRLVHAHRAGHRHRCRAAQRTTGSASSPSSSSPRLAPAHGHSHRYHRGHLAGRPPCHHHQRSRRARTSRQCRPLIFDKTGTLTYGRPTLTEILRAENIRADAGAATRRQPGAVYSKHPLAAPSFPPRITSKSPCSPSTTVSERPGEGLRGTVSGHSVQITGRNKVESLDLALPSPPKAAWSAWCSSMMHYAAAIRFHDAPRRDSASFIQHLQPKHGVRKVILLSGDRESEVQYLG